MYQLNKTIITTVGEAVTLVNPKADFEGTFYENATDNAVARIALINEKGDRFLKLYSWNTNGQSWTYEKVL